MTNRTFSLPQSGRLSRLLVSCLLVLWAGNVFAMSQLPSQVITSFYKWYIVQINHLQKNVTPTQNDEIFKYVSKDTVLGLRDRIKSFAEKEETLDSDYFFKTQDLDEKDWSQNINIGQQYDMRGFIVADVVLGSVYPSSRIFVVLRMEEGEWKIFKVLSTEFWTD